MSRTGNISDNLPPYYDEPEREMHRRRREAELRRRAPALEDNGFEYDDYEEVGNPFAQPHGQQHPRRRPEQTMKELRAPTFDNNMWCIVSDPEQDNFEVKTAVVHHLPKFGGLQGESAVKHLKEFHGICTTLKPYAASEDRFKLKVFHLSLTDLAKSWFLSLPPGSIRTWEQMQVKFLEKYYPPSKTNQVRRELSTIKQGPTESTYDYLERFNALEQSCCNLGFPEGMLVEFLLGGLRPLERTLLDAAAGGTVLNLTPSQVRKLIAETAECARFREETGHKDEFDRARNISPAEGHNSEMTKEIKELKEMMYKMMIGQQNRVKPCEFCHATTHKTDECPTLQEEEPVEVNGYQSYSNRPREFGLNANNFSWRNGGFKGNQGQSQQASIYQPPQQRKERLGTQNQQKRNYNQVGPSNASSSKVWEETIKELASTVQRNNGTLAELAKQMLQLATEMNELKKDKGQPSSRTIQNPKGNVSTMTLRNGKEIEGVQLEVHIESEPETGMEDEELQQNGEPQKQNSSETTPDIARAIEKVTSNHPLPFPTQVQRPKKNLALDQELLKLFSKVEITIPLVDAIQQIPKYAKFLKELCTNRRRGTNIEQVNLKNISALLQCKVAQKCKAQVRLQFHALLVI